MAPVQRSLSWPSVLIPTQERSASSVSTQSLTAGFMSARNVELGNIAPATEPRNQTVQNHSDNYIAGNGPDWHELASQLLSPDFIAGLGGELVVQRSEYQFLIDMLPSLLSAADKFVRKGEFPIWKNRWNHESLLGLIRPELRTALVVKVAYSFWDDDFFRLERVSSLIQAGKLLEADHLAHLREIREAINPVELIDSLARHDWSKHTQEVYSDVYFSLNFGYLVGAVIALPDDLHLQKLFNIVKNIPNDTCKIDKICALSVLYPAIQFFKNKCHEIFALAMEIGETGIKSSDFMRTSIELLIDMIENTKYLDEKDLETLVNFIMNYEGRDGYMKLLCSLGDAALRLDTRLYPMLINALAAKKKENNPDINSEVLDVLQAYLLPEESFHQLFSRIVDEKNATKREYMLSLLGAQIKHLSLENSKKVFQAIRCISDGPMRMDALRGPAANISNIFKLDKKAWDALLDDISTLNVQDASAKVFDVLIEVFKEIWASLQQQQAPLGTHL